jgi:heat shock protein HspQ
METRPEIKESRFSIGDLIHHTLFNYRGVIVDIDQTFQSTEEWYETVARSRPPKDEPWYHVLVHGATNTTYVAERHLEHDESKLPIAHPLLEEFFSRFENGRYVSGNRPN